MSKKRRAKDMHPAEIRMLVAKKGTSFAELGRKNGLAPTTIRNAIDKSYPRAEKIIANAIGLTPEEIWPTRY